MTRTLLTEAQVSVSATPVDGRPGRFLLQLITPGWGASGYYAPDVLEAAAAAKVFPAGLHMYLDHPHADGAKLDEHGNRSIADLAAVLAEDARWTGEALVAEATVFGAHRQTLADAHEAIGPSIRAYAEAEYGEAEGRRGTIVQSLVEAKSVDFVTRPGRGGRILQVIESQLVEESRNIGQWIESRIHRDFTITADDMAGDGRLTREERIGLSTAIGDALAAFVASLEANQPQLYTRDLWDDPQDTIATALEAAKNVPATRPDGTTIKESKEDAMPEIAESELARLREDAGRVQTLESERDAAVQRAETAETRADTAESALAESTRTSTVQRIVTEAADAAKVELSKYETVGVAADVVLNDDGTVNESESRTAFDTAIAAIKESRGSVINGFGRTSPPVPDVVSESDLDALGDATFGPIQTQEA